MEGILVILIALDWSKQMWYSNLIRFLADALWALPNWIFCLKRPILISWFMATDFNSMVVEAQDHRISMTRSPLNCFFCSRKSASIIIHGSLTAPGVRNGAFTLGFPSDDYYPCSCVWLSTIQRSGSCSYFLVSKTVDLSLFVWIRNWC